jgi:hypothetical protein
MVIFFPQKVKRDDMWEKDTMFHTLIVYNNGTQKKDAIMIILSLVSYQGFCGLGDRVEI